MSVSSVEHPEAPPARSSEGEQRTALISVAAAVVLVTVKLVTGLVTGSLAFIAEAAHSATDLVAALLTLFAVRVAVRPADREHQYGHGKAEHLAALGESAFLMLVSGAIGVVSVSRLVEGGGHGVEVTWWAIAVLGVVIAIDASRMVVSHRASKRYDSPALAANALHFGSDLLGSVAVLAGLASVSAGFEEGDAIAALVVAVLVVIAALRLARGSVDVLMDRSSADTDQAIEAALEGLDGPFELRRMRSRYVAGTYFVELVVGVGPDAGITQAHATADDIEAAVRAELPNTDVVVHVEPLETGGSMRERATAAALSVGEVREVHNVRVMRVDEHHEATLHAKVPGDRTLDQAHDTADLVEAKIHEAVPELARITTHIEPLSEIADVVRPGPDEVSADHAAIDAIVRRYTHAPPLDVTFRDAGRGRIAMVTVALPGDEPLRSAHRLAGHIEHDLREERPDLADAVVHTEPAGGG